jgi:hypothetical protein
MVLPINAMAVSYDGGESSVGTLILDNKNASTWGRITDGKYGIFTYNSSGETLDWSLAVTGLGDTPTDYSLIYFADPFAGNNPGALIWEGTSTDAGRIDMSASIDLNMDLPTAPDSNMVTDHSVAPDFYATPFGAKIWLVPSDCYNADENKVTSWSPERFLFETDLILYTDTDKDVSGTPLTTVVTSPPSIMSLGISPVEGLNFGSVAIGSCSGYQVITLTNTGTVPIKVTAIPSSGFYTTSLWFGDILAKNWISDKIMPSDSITVNAKVCPLAGLTGTVSGSVGFMASFAP